jgi:hypothetical protein
MKSLYDLTGVFLELTEIIEEQGGEIPEALEKALDSAEGEIEEKLEKIGHVFQNLKQESDLLNAERKAFVEEADRLRAQVSVRTARIASLKAYVAKSLEAMGISKQKTETFSFWIQSTDSVEEVDITKVPDKYKRVVYEEHIDKKAMKDDWKALEDREAHRDFGGARIVSNSSLRFR